MKKLKLKQLIFWVLCCDLSLIGKRLISPVSNLMNDLIRVPGGIGTSFSLLFLVLGAMLTPFFGSATLMGLLQSFIALSIGMVGSMGALSVIGYVVPGIVVDCVLYVTGKTHTGQVVTAVGANALASMAANLVANFITFHLKGLPLMICLSISFISGAIFGFLCSFLFRKLQPVIGVK